MNLHAQRGKGTPPSITATPATADFNFPINPATGGYPATTQQQFQLAVGGETPDPTFQFSGAQGVDPATDVVLKDSSGKTLAAGAKLPKGTYTLTITVADPGQGSNWKLDIDLDSGKLGKANTSLSGKIGRDMAPAPTQQQTPAHTTHTHNKHRPNNKHRHTTNTGTNNKHHPHNTHTHTHRHNNKHRPTTNSDPTTNTGPTTNTTPNNKHRPNNSSRVEGQPTPSPKLMITPWGGGSGYYPSGTRFSVMLNTQTRKIKIGTAVAVANKPIGQSPKRQCGECNETEHGLCAICRSGTRDSINTSSLKADREIYTAKTGGRADPALKFNAENLQWKHSAARGAGRWPSDSQDDAPQTSIPPAPITQKIQE